MLFYIILVISSDTKDDHTKRSLSFLLHHEVGCNDKDDKQNIFHPSKPLEDKNIVYNKYFKEPNAPQNKNNHQANPQGSSSQSVHCKQADHSMPSKSGTIKKTQYADFQKHKDPIRNASEKNPNFEETMPHLSEEFVDEIQRHVIRMQIIHVKEKLFIIFSAVISFYANKTDEKKRKLDLIDLIIQYFDRYALFSEIDDLKFNDSINSINKTGKNASNKKENYDMEFRKTKSSKKEIYSRKFEQCASVSDNSSFDHKFAEASSNFISYLETCPLTQKSGYFLQEFQRSTNLPLDINNVNEILQDFFGQMGKFTHSQSKKIKCRILIFLQQLIKYNLSLMMSTARFAGKRSARMN